MVLGLFLQFDVKLYIGLKDPAQFDKNNKKYT